MTQDYADQIEASKALLKRKIPDLSERFHAETQRLTLEVAAVKDEMNTGHAVIEIDYGEIINGAVTPDTIDRFKRRGVVVIRNVFDRDKVQEWNNELHHYIQSNQYFEKQKEKAGLDSYFGNLASSKPQIFGIYWSRPQMEARQSKELAITRQWLNKLWNHPDNNKPEFDASIECLYADRIRQREPGDASLGLSPHVDGGSIERWIDPSFYEVYNEVFFGNIDRYDPFNVRGRVHTREIPSPAVCRMFRTYQGWTALTRQGPGDGTLNVVPIARAMVWVLLRALQHDIDMTDLCGAKAGRALGITEKHHNLLLNAYVPIPTVEPGDTVWWHPDVIHGVEDRHLGSEYSNVMYIGAAPKCAKNENFLKLLRPAFEEGRSSPDFAPEDYETEFSSRFMKEHLSPLGRVQMGYDT
jgi:hypothetical protein